MRKKTNPETTTPLTLPLGMRSLLECETPCPERGEMNTSVSREFYGPRPAPQMGGDVQESEEVTTAALRRGRSSGCGAWPGWLLRRRMTSHGPEHDGCQ